MITTIGSLVQETSQRARWFIAISCYTVACFTTSSLLGGMFGSIGQLFHDAGCRLFPCSSVSPIESALIGIMALAYAVSDVGIIPLPRPRLMNAVPVTWWRWWRPYGAALAYGAALGLGVTTRVQFGAFYILCLWCLFKGNTAYGGALMGLYGATRALTLIPASLGVYGSNDCRTSERRLGKILRLLGSAKLIVAMGLVLFGTFVLASPFF